MTEKREMVFSFVLAAYNEEKSVLPLLEQITSAMEEISSNYEIIFVIEGNDNTYPILQEYQTKNPSVKMKLFYEKNQLGLMRAIKKGFMNISPESTHVVTMDVDLNHKPSELPRLISKAKLGYDIVIGSRAVKGAKVLAVPVWKRIVSKFANTVFNTCFKIKVKDKTSGYRLIKSDVIKEIAPLVKSNNFDGLMEFLLVANRRKKTFAEVPITLTYREHGTTKFNVIKTGKDYAKLFLRGFKK